MKWDGEDLATGEGSPVVFCWGFEKIIAKPYAAIYGTL